MFNKPSEKIDINSPDPNSDIYISEGERFNKDFASYDYNRRNIEHERKKEMYQNKKNQLYERERKRWEKMDYEYLKAENKIMMNKERNLVGRKNNPGMAFNPLTLQYDNSVQGEILKRRDDESKFRALMRATNIDKHANAGYNIINGEERTIMENRMKKEIEPSVYQKNIDKIKQINQRHNDNDNFYTKGPYSQPKTQFQQNPELNQNDYMNRNDKINNEYQPMPIPQREQEFNNNPPNENFQRMSPQNDNRQMSPQNDNFNNIPPNDNYQRMSPNNNNFNNNSPNITPNQNNYDRRTPNNNFNNVQDNRDYRSTPQNENNYRRMTPSNNGYNQLQPNEQMIPDHYSEQNRGFQNNRHDFDRQYNYIGDQNNFNDNNNQAQNDYYPNSQNFNQRDDGFNRNRDPYARPDYYANNRPK